LSLDDQLKKKEMGWSMKHVGECGELERGVWWRNLKGRDHLREAQVGE
jgi:hypothetical protein